MTFRVIALACVLVVATLGAEPAHARTIGQIIDDAAIVAAVKAKITADKLSNLVRIDVKSNDGVVTLSGTVDSLERRDRIVQIATWVDGVKRVVDDIRVTGSGATPSAAAPATSRPATGGAPIDATGRVAAVEPTTGTLTLADGRMLRLGEGAAIWQSSTLQALTPGSQVLIRNAMPAGIGGREASAARGWRMGTVSSVDRGAGQVVLSDGSVVRVTPSTVVQRGAERLSLDALQPGWEVVVSVPPAPAAEASRIDVVWAPTASVR
jgi:hypothetical protein